MCMSLLPALSQQLEGVLLVYVVKCGSFCTVIEVPSREIEDESLVCAGFYHFPAVCKFPVERRKEA